MLVNLTESQAKISPTDFLKSISQERVCKWLVETVMENPRGDGHGLTAIKPIRGILYRVQRNDLFGRRRWRMS